MNSWNEKNVYSINAPTLKQTIKTIVSVFETEIKKKILNNSECEIKSGYLVLSSFILLWNILSGPG